jgi:hypothetical protein
MHKAVPICVLVLSVLAIAAAPLPRPGTGIYLIGRDAPSNLSAYTVALMQAWDFTKKQHATAAGVVPIAYKDLSSTRSNDCRTNIGGRSRCIVNGVICPPGVHDAPYYAGGLGFCRTWRNHPAWFYRHDGHLVQYAGFPGHYLMNWRSTEYQRAWAAHVTRAAKRGGWSWVWADNALVNPRSYTAFYTYGGAAGTQSATKAMLTTIGPILHAAGIKFIPNLGFTNLYPTLWNSWLPLVDGFGNEHSVGNVAGQRAACLARAKVCFFGDTGGLNPTFRVVAP